MTKFKQSTETFVQHASTCRCADDDNCGCTYPENVSEENTEEPTMSQETFKIKTEEGFIAKDSVCYCTPKDCKCKIEYHESDY